DGDGGPAGAQHHVAPGVGEHLGEGRPPRPGAQHRSAGHADASGRATDALRGGVYSTGGAVSPRTSASMSRSRSMIASVISPSTWVDGSRPAHRDRSSGGPATTVTGVRGRSRSFFVRTSKIRCGPHITTGTTGAPVASQSRATPVLPRMGHRSGSLVVVPSG